MTITEPPKSTDTITIKLSWFFSAFGGGQRGFCNVELALLSLRKAIEVIAISFLPLERGNSSSNTYRLLTQPQHKNNPAGKTFCSLLDYKA